MKKRNNLLPESWDCPQIFRDRLGTAAGHQRIMVHEGHLLIILHEPPEPEQNHRVGRIFWRDPNGEWKSSEKLGKGALTLHLQEFKEKLLELEAQEDQATRAEDYYSVLERISPMYRTISHLHQTLQDARKAVSQDKDLIDFRDQAYQLMRIAELCQSSAKNGLEFANARKTEEQAAAALQMSVAAHRLNILAGFFFPIVTIASIFGMGLVEVEESNRTIVFTGLMAAGLIGGAILTAFMTAKPKKS